MSRARTFLLWSARILGILLFLLIVAFAIGESMPEPARMGKSELWLTISLIVMILGSIAGLFRSWLGALLLLLGSCAFTVINDISAPVPVVMLFLIDGILYLAAACCKGRSAEA